MLPRALHIHLTAYSGYPRRIVSYRIIYDIEVDRSIKSLNFGVPRNVLASALTMKKIVLTSPTIISRERERAPACFACRPGRQLSCREVLDIAKCILPGRIMY